MGTYHANVRSWRVWATCASIGVHRWYAHTQCILWLRTVCSPQLCSVSTPLHRLNPPMAGGKIPSWRDKGILNGAGLPALPTQQRLPEHTGGLQCLPSASAATDSLAVRYIDSIVNLSEWCSSEWPDAHARCCWTIHRPIHVTIRVYRINIWSLCICSPMMKKQKKKMMMKKKVQRYNVQNYRAQILRTLMKYFFSLSQSPLWLFTALM